MSPKSTPPRSSRPPRPKRGRPPSIDSEALLEVARQVFLERGFQATTEEVAQRAGISEGLLFHRFKTKEGLFRSAMNVPKDSLVERMGQVLDEIHGLELREALVQLAESMMNLGRIALPLMMMSWSNPQSCAGAAYDQNRAKHRVALTRLAQFFESHMEAGSVRNMDSEIIARAFLGAVHHYCMSRIMAGEHEPGAIPERMFLRGLVDLLLEGMLVSPQASGEASHPQRRIPAR